MKKRTLTILIAVVLVVACAVGGTLAWLKVQTQEVTNTFTAGDINITLAETTTDYKMVPGNNISKDPKVTVKAGSEACWLFVKVDKSDNYGDFLEDYAIAEGWTLLGGEGNDGVYYREVAATTVDTSFYVLSGNKVTVKTGVTKAMLNTIDGVVAEDATEDAEAAEIALRPTLTFTAYAIQKDNFPNVSAAWNEAKTL